MKKCVAGLIATLLSLAVAHAQETQPCASLLEAVRPSADWSDIHSFETHMTITKPMNGETFTSTLHAIFDLDSKRIYQTMDFGNEQSVIIRYCEGEATMAMPGTDMTMPPPPAVVTQLEQQLEQLLEGGFATPSAIAGEVELLSCDAKQQYGNVLSGKQVTVRLETTNSLLRGVMPDGTAKFIFSEGQLKGQIMELPEVGPVLTVFEEITTTAEGLTERITMHQYSLDDGEVRDRGLVTLEYTYNQPIDETLFNP